MTYLQSLDKALDLFIEFKFCESDFFFLNRSKICMVATYNFGSVYMYHLYLLYQYLPINTICWAQGCAEMAN